eukprot:1149909-Pelagomonas_calceolata.AAC.3
MRVGRRGPHQKTSQPAHPLNHVIVSPLHGMSTALSPRASSASWRSSKSGRQQSRRSGRRTPRSGRQN